MGASSTTPASVVARASVRVRARTSLVNRFSSSFAGSGVVVRDEGRVIVVTCAHVVRAQVDAARAVETLRSKMYAHKSL